MFADDPICSTQTRIYTVFLKVNVELQKINEWFICNNLSLNVKKKTNTWFSINLAKKMIFH